MSRWIPLLFLTAAVLVFWHGVLFIPGVSVPWDFRQFHLPLVTAYADSLAEGEWPLWDPYTYCGRPLLANPQTGVFYPGVFLVALWGRDHVLRGMELLLVFHVLLAAWFTFLVARRMGASEPAAVLGGLMFSLGGWVASQAQHLSTILGAPWLAACWLALLLPPRRRLALLTVSLTLHFFAGFPGSTLSAGVSTLLVACLLARKERRLPLDVLLAGALALLCGAIQLWPTLELIGHSVGQYRWEWLTGGAGIPWRGLLSLVWPRIEGPYDPTMLYLFSSISGLALALWAVKRNRAWALAALLFAFLMTGEYNPAVKGLFQLLPRQARNAVYWYLYAAPFLLALALLAARGADLLLRKPSWRWAAAALAAVELVAAGSGQKFNTQRLAAEPMATGGAFDGSPDALRHLREVTGQDRYDAAGDGLWPVNGGPILRLRSASGYDPLALERLIQVRLGLAEGQRWGAWYQVERPQSEAVRLMSIRSLLRPGTAQLPAPWRLAAELPGRQLWERPDTLPRFRLVSQTRPASGLAEASALIKASGFRPDLEAVVEGAPALSGSGGSVRVLSESRHHIELETDAPGASFLATSEVHYPGWAALLDSQPAPILFTNVAFKGLTIPSGRHRVELVFHSLPLVQGAAVSLLGVVLLIVLIRKRKRPGQAGPFPSADGARS